MVQKVLLELQHVRIHCHVGIHVLLGGIVLSQDPHKLFSRLLEFLEEVGFPVCWFGRGVLEVSHLGILFFPGLLINSFDEFYLDWSSLCCWLVIVLVVERLRSLFNVGLMLLLPFLFRFFSLQLGLLIVDLVEDFSIVSIFAIISFV